MSNFYIKSGTTFGSGDSDVVISTTSANGGRESLKGRFRVTFDYEEFATISLEQIGVGKILNIVDYTQSLEADETIVSISGTANVSDITLSRNGSININGNNMDDWDGMINTAIIGDPGRKSIYDYVIKIDVGVNSSSSSRIIQIILSDGKDIIRTLDISQAGNGDTPVPPGDKYLYFGDPGSTAKVSFSSDGGDRVIPILANVDWRIVE